MDVITLFLIVLAVNGPAKTFEDMQMEFKTKAACEAVRQALIKKASTQEHVFMISGCGAGKDPVAFGMFFGPGVTTTPPKNRL